MATHDLDAVEPMQQFVLLAVIELRHREDLPVHSFDVTSVCEEYLDEFEQLSERFPGGITRQRVIRALSELEDAGLLGKETKQSATGKGRPAYSLSMEEQAILDDLGDEERFASVVERVRDHSE